MLKSKKHHISKNGEVKGCPVLSLAESPDRAALMERSVISIVGLYGILNKHDTVDYRSLFANINT